MLLPAIICIIYYIFIYFYILCRCVLNDLRLLLNGIREVITGSRAVFC